MKRHLLGALVLVLLVLLPPSVAAEGPTDKVAQAQAQYTAALKEYSDILSDIVNAPGGAVPDTQAMTSYSVMQQSVDTIKDMKLDDNNAFAMAKQLLLVAQDPTLAKWRTPAIDAQLKDLGNRLETARSAGNNGLALVIAKEAFVLFQPVEQAFKADEANKKRDAAKAKVEEAKKQLEAAQHEQATGQSKTNPVSTVPELPPPQVGQNIFASVDGSGAFIAIGTNFPTDARVQFEINGTRTGFVGTRSKVDLVGKGPFDIKIFAEWQGKQYSKHWGVFDPANKAFNAPPPEKPSKPADANKGSDKTAGNSPYTTTAGDPVSTSLGEYFFSIPLLVVNASLPIDLSLYYASSIDKNLGVWNDPFIGDRFTHNYHVALERTDNAIAIFFGSGQTLNFQKSGDAWQVVGETIAYQLKETSKHYWLLDPIADVIFIFDKTSGTVGTNVLTMIQDRNGNSLTLLNDLSGRVASISDNLGSAIYFTYDKGRLTKVSDTFGRVVQFGYAGDATTMHLVAITDTLGAKTTFAHTGPVTNTAIASITYPKGNTPYTQQWAQTSGQWSVTEQKDALGNVTKMSVASNAMTVIDPSGTTTQHAYKDTGISGIKDASGKSSAFEYDAQGRLSTVTDRLGDKTLITYNASGKIASIKNANGSMTSFTYVPQEQLFLASDGEQIIFGFTTLTRVDLPDKASQQLAYDVRGNVVSRTDATGQTWKYTYNQRGQVLTVTNPLNGVTTYTYNTNATLASVKDSETGETKFDYDHAQRLTKTTRADGNSVEYIYDQNNRLTMIIEPNFRFTRFEYDANGNLSKLIDPNGKATTYEYDAMDRVTKSIDRTGQASILTYDKLGRRESVTDPTGIATQYGYDPRGWLNQITRGGNVWKLGYDDEGILAFATSPLGNTVKYQSDKLGRLIGVTDALGNSGTLARDGLNRITGITDALKRQVNYGYDARGLLTSVTQPVIGETKYEYDALGNLTKLTDLNGRTWSFTYSPMGRLLTSSDPLKQTTKYGYDNLGRVSQITYADGMTSTVQYDASGNASRIKYSDGTQFTYVYNAQNHLVGANDVFLTRDAEGRIVNSTMGGAKYGATYDNAGRLKTATYPLDGDTLRAFAVTYTYDAKTGLLASVSDSLTKAQVDFTYDKDNRLIGMARSNKVNTALTWDNNSRLTGIKDGTVTNLQYTLDAAGKVTNAKLQMPLAPIPQSQTATQGVQFDAASQVSSNGYKYDARGQMTQSPDGTFKWNGASQLVGIGQATLAYNGLGDIVSRGTTQFGYNYALGLAPIVAETSGAATARYYVWTPNGELLYTIENTKPLFYHFDRTGSTIALTDANGRVTDAYAYDPYGKMLGHAGKSTQPFTFTGRWGVRQESATLYHMRVRYYDATTQRFLSRDPIWPQIADAREMNPYLYVGDDPLNYVDVTGLGPDTFGNPRVTYVGRRDSTDMTGSHPGPEFDDMWGFSNEEFRKMLPPNAPQMQQPRHVTVQGIGGSRDSASKFWSLVAKSVLGSKTYRTDGFSQDLVWDFNTLLEVAKQSTIDDQERVKLYAQAEQIINVDDPVMIPLYWYTRVTLTQPWIQGRSVEQKHEFFYNYKVLRE